MIPGQSLLSMFFQSITFVSTMTNSRVPQGFLHAPRLIYLSLFPFTAVIWHNEVDFQLYPDFTQIYFQVATRKPSTPYSYYFDGHQHLSVKQLLISSCKEE